MKIEINRVAGGPIKFSAFADRHDLTLEVNERPGVFDGRRYYAHFKKCEVKRACGLLGLYGNGRTPEVATAAYSEALRGETLVIDAFADTRREIQCPNEWEPEA